ncbi:MULTISPECIES: CvpA family protein [Chelativorans]|jgi:membrane protein required for colicin V production|uniref:Colicin V production protein n=1 Tax=Chelativorans sp. (strain BNC1) TaxID=266779 RepID=Q11JP4_CHESB|nr:MULTISPECIES: CvpA family protein [Chelativorans]
MPITLLDGILVGFTLVSAMLAMVRGFSREVLSIASWVLAAIAAYFLYPVVLPYLTPYIDNPMLAVVASAAAVFFVALIIVTIITMKIADFIVDSRIGALDRTLGFLYGAARGVLVVAVALLFLNWLLGSNPPAWITEAKSRPLLEGVGSWLQSLLPEDPETTIFDRLSPNAPEADPAPNTGSPQQGAADGAETSN